MSFAGRILWDSVLASTQYPGCPTLISHRFRPPGGGSWGGFPLTSPAQPADRPGLSRPPCSVPGVVKTHQSPFQIPTAAGLPPSALPWACRYRPPARPPAPMPTPPLLTTATTAPAPAVAGRHLLSARVSVWGNAGTCLCSVSKPETGLTEETSACL